MEATNVYILGQELGSQVLIYWVYIRLTNVTMPTIKS